jgi:hypothetical protein
MGIEPLSPDLVPNVWCLGQAWLNTWLNARDHLFRAWWTEHLTGAVCQANLLILKVFLQISSSIFEGKTDHL